MDELVAAFNRHFAAHVELVKAHDDAQQRLGVERIRLDAAMRREAEKDARIAELVAEVERWKADAHSLALDREKEVAGLREEVKALTLRVANMREHPDVRKAEAAALEAQILRLTAAHQELIGGGTTPT